MSPFTVTCFEHSLACAFFCFNLNLARPLFLASRTILKICNRIESCLHLYLPCWSAAGHLASTWEREHCWPLLHTLQDASTLVYATTYSSKSASISARSSFVVSTSGVDWWEPSSILISSSVSRTPPRWNWMQPSLSVFGVLTSDAKAFFELTRFFVCRCLSACSFFDSWTPNLSYHLGLWYASIILLLAPSFV